MTGTVSSVQICFDEAGNTGQHLVDPNQPVFTTAAVAVSEEQLGAIRDLLKWRPEEELPVLPGDRGVPSSATET